MYVSASLSQRTTWHECHIIHKNQKRFFWADFSIRSPSRVTYIGTASSHTAFPSCPSRRNLQGATPGKCVSLKFRCCFISLSPVATPVGTNLCLEPSQAQCNQHRGASSHEMGFCHPYPYANTLQIKVKIKSDVCVSYSTFQCSWLRFWSLNKV